MNIELVRVDDRLIHAQIVEGWMRSIAADRIVIVSDEVAGDEIQKTMYSMSVPYGIKVSCLSISAAIEALKNDSFRGENVIILLPSMYEAWRLVEAGVEIKTINIGGLHAKPNKKFYTPTISLDDKDFEYIKLLTDRGIELETRVLPSNERTQIEEIIGKAKDL